MTWTMSLWLALTLLAWSLIPLVHWLHARERRRWYREENELQNRLSKLVWDHPFIHTPGDLTHCNHPVLSGVTPLVVRCGKTREEHAF